MSVLDHVSFFAAAFAKFGASSQAKMQGQQTRPGAVGSVKRAVAPYDRQSVGIDPRDLSLKQWENTLRQFDWPGGTDAKT